MNLSAKPLEVGDQIEWVGSLKTSIPCRTGTIVEVLPNNTQEIHFTSYRIRRNDGVEGIYYRTQLELVDGTNPQGSPEVVR